MSVRNNIKSMKEKGQGFVGRVRDCWDVGLYDMSWHAFSTAFVSAGKGGCIHVPVVIGRLATRELTLLYIFATRKQVTIPPACLSTTFPPHFLKPSPPPPPD